MSLELVPFCTYTGSINKPDLVADTPKGRRVVMGLADVRWEGERFNASQHGSSAGDWLIISPDGVAMVDVRLSLRTDDGAYVYVEYQGRADWSAGVMTSPALCSFHFETGDEQYAWMNSSLFVGKGEVSDGGVSYTVYELR